MSLQETFRRAVAARYCRVAVPHARIDPRYAAGAFATRGPCPSCRGRSGQHHSGFGDRHSSHRSCSVR
jgi:hypothetical protein